VILLAWCACCDRDLDLRLEGVGVEYIGGRDSEKARLLTLPVTLNANIQLGLFVAASSTFC
jgi:hypothetical protein